MRFSRVSFIMWVARRVGVPIDVRAEYFFGAKSRAVAPNGLPDTPGVPRA